MITVDSDAANIIASLMDQLMVTSSSVSMQDVSRLAEALADNLLLGSIVTSMRAILDEKGFVQVVGIAFDKYPALGLYLIQQMGEVFIDPNIETPFISAHAKPSQTLMGNQLRRLPLHTDYSMLENPPRLTASICVNPDPSEFLGGLNIVDVEGLVYGTSESSYIKRLRTVRFPFGSQQTLGTPVVYESPILTKDVISGRWLVRYHRSRIVQGYRILNCEPTGAESALLYEFEHLMAPAVQKLRIVRGCLTILDNHRCLHGRERCSVRLMSTGRLQGREMKFAFAY